MAANYTVKESITFALIHLMETMPYEKISITDIVQKSGVCRASFYRNYRSKEEILRNYIKYAMRNCPEYYSEQTDTDESAHVYSICGAIRENRVLFDALKQNQLMHLLHEQILETVLSYISAHQLNLGNYEISFLSHAALGILLEWISGGYRESEEELTHICLKLLRMRE